MKNLYITVKFYLYRTYQILRNWYIRYTGLLDIGYLRKWMTIGIVVGVVAGLGAIVFYSLIDWSTKILLGYIAGYYAPQSGGEGVPVVSAALRWWAIPIVTTLGGLISGLIVFKFAPEAEGHGTDAAINAFHRKDGVIRKRVPLVKLIASAITIGSGGSAGREGPVALIGAGFGSVLGDIFKLSTRDRRIALTIGMGAGIGSIFKAPLGGALLGTEILYRRDFETDAIFPSFIASITGYMVFASWNGWAPVFSLPAVMTFTHPLHLVGYMILGLVCGIVGMFYGKTFYKTRDFFRKLTLPNYLKPAIGGLCVGIIAIFLPQVMGMGYGWVQMAINGEYSVFPVYIMFAAVIAKIVATSLSIGSGGSGGVFAPGLVIGGLTGGVLWSVMQNYSLIVPDSPAPFVIVGMMALFGGIAKAPLAIMIMVSEMTNSYALLAPCMIAVVIAYFVTGKSYIYENQVPSRADSPAHKYEYSTSLLTRLKVNEAMHQIKAVVSPDTDLKEIEILMKNTRHDALPVMYKDSIVGIIANLDVIQVPKADSACKHARDIMSTNLIVCSANEQLDIALERMSDNKISHLPVMDANHPRMLIGMLCIEDIVKTYRSHVRNAAHVEH